MTDREADTRPGSVRAAVTSYRHRISEGNSKLEKFETSFQEKPFAKRRELHWAKRDTNQLAESRRNAELATAEARSELFAAKKMAKELKRRIDESNARAKSETEELEKLRTGKREEEEWSDANLECEKVLRELEMAKRELSKLKMDMASVVEERRRAEKEMNASVSRRESCLSSAESLSKEIEEVNEEHVLVELARLEAIKEYEEIEAQAREQAEMYASRKEEQNIIDEVADAKELEARLMITMSEISELKQVKEMKKGVEKELAATKKELERVKEGSFEFMASMDVVRDELARVMGQTARLREEEKEAEVFIRSLNAKLAKAKAKLGETSAAEGKAKAIISDLKRTLEQLESEAEAHGKERSLSSEETAAVKAEIQKSETETDLYEERLQAALRDLKAVKSSEAAALESLRSVIEKTVRSRTSASRASPTITISKFEYEYLKGNAAGAKEIADKKVAAARAWVGALKASEREIQIKAELFRRETRELQVEEGLEVHHSENEFQKWRQMMGREKLSPAKTALHVKALNKSVRRTPTRRGVGRRSASPVVHGTPRSTSFTVGRRRKVIPNLAKFFRGKPVESDLQPTK
ncbi:protein PLASTID MOVEMENT IMPAIRED 2-like isoform X1 [Salvia divinorum]|uniref:Protein PLASTID MOVEMENT IMPAIRED 2-like isoform X1 n=1 Tax=Salvia divinorum TaxID=28513 RepID=A0ABD1IDM8_SALDI